jgi:hypothetical protein
MKNFLILLVFVLFSHEAYSQIALRAGLNYSKVSVESGGPDFGTDPKPGYHIGLQGNIGLPGFLSIRPALLYNIKGGNEDQTGGGSSKLQYFDIPLNLAINLGTDDLKVIIEGGPYFGYLLDASSDFIADIKNRISKSDWGANFGAVVEISSLGIGVNYSNSLSDISKSDQLNQAFKLKNGNLALFLYVKF